MKRVLLSGLVVTVIAGSCTVHTGARSGTGKNTTSTSSTGLTLFGETTTTAAGKAAKNGKAKSATTKPGAGGTTTSTAPVDRHGGPRPGTYQYDTTLTSGTKVQQGISGYQVTDDRPFAGGFRQITTWVEGSAADRRLVDWRDSGRTLEYEQQARGKSVGPLCDWIPDYVEVITPLTVGAKWSAQTGCDEGHTLTVDRTVSYEVTGAEQVVVDGTTVATFVIHRKQSSTQHVGGHLVRTDEDYNEKFAPSVGVIVSMTGTDQDYLDNVPKGLRTRTRNLKSLKPTT